MARTPFKLKSGNAPLKQNIFKGRKGYKSKSIKSGLESFFGGVQSEISNLASSVSDASKKDVPREIAKAVSKKVNPDKKEETKSSEDGGWKTDSKTKNIDKTSYKYYRGSGMSNFEKRQAMRKAARKATSPTKHLGSATHPTGAIAAHKGHMSKTLTTKTKKKDK